MFVVMKCFITIFIIVIFSNSVVSHAMDIKYISPDDVSTFDTIPSMVYDRYFEASYNELCDMFEGKTSYNLKRAEFLVENAFYGGTMNYSVFSGEIDSIVCILNKFIDVNGFRQYKTAPNFAIFEYMTKPSVMNGNLKFTYDFDDPIGQKDFSVFFISKLLKTHRGQCTSMPILYKILCDELGGQSSLAFAPMHMYIKHIGEDNKWVNVELTHGGFVRDAWMIEQMGITTEAIKNGIFLTALNEKETIGLMIMILSRAYRFKYSRYDEFVGRSINKVLEILPSFSNALLMKLNYHYCNYESYMTTYSSRPSSYADFHYHEYKRILNLLDRLGYTQPNLDNYSHNIKHNQRIANDLTN